MKTVETDREILLWSRTSSVNMAVSLWSQHKTAAKGGEPSTYFQEHKILFSSNSKKCCLKYWDTGTFGWSHFPVAMHAACTWPYNCLIVWLCLDATRIGYFISTLLFLFTVLELYFSGVKMCNPKKKSKKLVLAAPFLLCLPYDSDVNSTLLAFLLKSIVVTF